MTNILVIGAGAAGLRAAIAAYQAGREVVIVGKRARGDAHTVLAAGGINAALGTVDPQDSWQQHFADTLREGYYLADPRTVELMACEAPAAVQELADWGCAFARTATGQLDQRFFGAHKYRRTCYVGDYTGRAILEALLKQVGKLGIPIHDNQYVAQLLVYDQVCFGALAFDLFSGERTLYLADAVVLATGGHTRLWRRSSSRRDENTGDGLYLALQAGCQLMDMEMVQFHPTGMVAPEELAGTLVTEAVRGEGGRLYNNLGERFMQRYDPERLELSTRDRVALANYTEIIAGRGGPNGGVFLDISHRSKAEILEKLPRMYRQFMEAQLLDITQQSMEVAPTAHYSMGGIRVEPESHATGVEGLYAAGEVSSGLHGANRLGGNSLTETLVFGRRAGAAASVYSETILAQLRARVPIAQAHDLLNELLRPGNELARPLQRALRNAMWEGCGVVRNAEQLQQTLTKLAELRNATASLDVRCSSEGYQDLVLALDLRASLVAAAATVQCAIERRESRGSHQRSDYPTLDPTLQLNLLTKLDSNGNLTIDQAPISPIPAPLQAWLSEAEVPAAPERLLE